MDVLKEPRSFGIEFIQCMQQNGISGGLPYNSMKSLVVLYTALVIAYYVIFCESIDNLEKFVNLFLGSLLACQFGRQAFKIFFDLICVSYHHQIDLGNECAYSRNHLNQ